MGEEIETSVAKSPLFQLPKELRIAIYSDLLSTPTAIRWPDEHQSTELTPAILRTCSAIHKEAVDILYSSNILAFQHPSDCNMFGWVHSPDYAKLITRLALHIKDKDSKPIWVPYLSSTYPFRSLQADYPALQTVHITWTTNAWMQTAGTAEHKFANWVHEKRLEELICSMDEIRNNNGFMIKLTAVHRVPMTDVQHLKRSHPEQLMPDCGADEYRSVWHEFRGFWISLVLVGIRAL